MTTRIPFGQALRMKRRERNISQELLATETGLSRISIVHIESGKSDPRFEHTARRIVDYFGMSFDEFLHV